jgi:hypothetical protein
MTSLGELREQVQADSSCHGRLRVSLMALNKAPQPNANLVVAAVEKRTTMVFECGYWMAGGKMTVCNGANCISAGSVTSHSEAWFSGL